MLNPGCRLSRSHAGGLLRFKTVCQFLYQLGEGHALNFEIHFESTLHDLIKTVSIPVFQRFDSALNRLNHFVQLFFGKSSHVRASQNCHQLLNPFPPFKQISRFLVEIIQYPQGLKIFFRLFKRLQNCQTLIHFLSRASRAKP